MTGLVIRLMKCYWFKGKALVVIMIVTGLVIRLMKCYWFKGKALVVIVVIMIVIGLVIRLMKSYWFKGKALVVIVVIMIVIGLVIRLVQGVSKTSRPVLELDDFLALLSELLIRLSLLFSGFRQPADRNIAQ